MTTEASVRTGAPADLSGRIDKMYARDRLWAWGFVIALWLVVAFVLLSSIPYANGSVTAVCWIAAIVLLVFNTGSIANMVRHYGHDKERIYGTDIRHLDAGR
jgi:TM2 domain-containing membrane protein YozV